MNKLNPHSIQNDNEYNNNNLFQTSILYKNINKYLKFYESNNTTNGHLKFGQLKLLISEIQFISTLILNKLIDNKNLSNYVILYIGSESGIHIPTLIKLFPDFKYVLADPRKWSYELNSFSKFINKNNNN